ncbi:MAG: WD40 repeat domain-containing protein, partial [bacterium]|nr:WD40 repeat domain-containing protein [bacterium]
AGYYHEGNDKSLRLWDKEGNLIKTLEGNSREIEGMFQTTQGYYLAWESGNEGQGGFNIYLWDIEGNLLKVMAGHTSRIRCVIETRAGQILSCGVDAKIRVWDKDGNLQNIMTGHDKQITALKQLKNGLFVSSDTDDITIIWDEVGNLIKKLGKKRDDIGSVIMLDDNRYVSYRRFKFFLWDADWNLLDILETPLYGDKKPIWEWAKTHHIDPMIFYSGDSVIGKYRLSAYWRWDIQIYHPETGETIHTFYADAQFFTKPIIIKEDDYFIVIIGDMKGRILFLRWREE